MQKTIVTLPPDFKIEKGAHLSLLGSCFSSNFAKKFQQAGHFVQSNPFGVIFDPFSISQLLEFVVTKNSSPDLRIISREDLYFSWLANSTCYAFSEQELKDLLKNQIYEFRQVLEKSDYLFVTFGTAWVYEWIEGSFVVANCHKFPNNLFEKKLFCFQEIMDVWQNTLTQLIREFPKLQIVFTLSPVRHKKDGLIENSRSKALLLNTIHHLKEMFRGKVHYFASYELVMDELRDYAYFNKDGLHLNDIAVDYLWERFFSTHYSDENRKDILRYQQLIKSQRHSPLHPGSLQDKLFRDKLETELKHFKEVHPYFCYLEG